MFSVTKPQQYVDAASQTDYVVTKTASATRKFDSVTTMRVCRVCLTSSVKMYEMSEHKLSAMYEQITGVVINTEDVLPKILCWECVTRLSSAHCFREKALKTHWLLEKKLKCSKIVTVSDIESIDRARYQLVSTLGFKYNKENCYDLHIVDESDKIHEKEYDGENFNNCEDTEMEYCKLNYADQNNAEGTIIKTEVTDDKDPIKIENLNANEEQNLGNENYIGAVISDEKNHLTIHHLDARVYVNIKESISDEEEIDIVNSEMCSEENQILEARELCEELKQSQKTQQREKRRSEALPRCKEPVVLEDNLSKHNTPDMSKQLADTDESSNENWTICRPPFKRVKLSKNTTKGKYIQSSLENKNVCDPANADNISAVSIGIVDVVENVTKSMKNVSICDICGKQFQFKTTLIQHIRKHPKMYSCTYCSYKTVKRYTLSCHVNAMHTKTEVYNCSLCSFKSYRKNHLTRHVNVKHTKTNVYDCSYCSYKAHYKVHLTAHVNAKHTKTNVYDCTYCNYKTYNKGHLTVHVNAIHTKTNVFNCSHCSFKCYRKDILTAHVNAKHTKTIVYDCTYCSYKAYYKGQLSTHINARHTKTNFYNCSFCSFKTSDKGSLIKHVNAKHT